MASIFQLSPTDQSICYLFGIFGNGLIDPDLTGYCPTSGFPNLLGSMFAYFNSIILAVGALVVVYVTVVGVMNTAHQGKFMGKDWNNLWLPLRTVMGITALVPTSAGYSYLQIMMMWAIIQGIGAADGLWSTALHHMSAAYSPVAPVTPPLTQVKQSMQQLFQGLVCAVTSKQTGDNWRNISPVKGTQNSYYCFQNPTTSFCSSPQAYLQPGYVVESDGNFGMGPNNACGILSYCNMGECGDDPDQIQCAVCTAQQAALSAIIPGLVTLANTYVQIDHEYIGYWNYDNVQRGSADTSESAPPLIAGAGLQSFGLPESARRYCQKKGESDCSSKTLPNPFISGSPEKISGTIVTDIYWPEIACTSGGADAGSTLCGGSGRTRSTHNLVTEAVKTYSDMLKVALDTSTTRESSSLTGDMGSTKATSEGWILAGSYYLSMTSIAVANVSASAPTFELNTPDDEQPGSKGTTLYQFRTNIEAAQQLISAANGSASGSSNAVNQQASPMKSGTEDTKEVFKSATRTTTATFGRVNPVVQIATAGWALLLVVQIIYLVLLVLAIILGIIGGLGIFILGTGIHNPLENVFTFIYYLLIPLIFLLLGTMVTLGATLGVYVPLVPYIIFTVAAIGWLFSTVEAMVAGPLVALGILSPSGHHELLGKAEPALMMIFAIFLRPSLMIFGLIVSMLMSIVVVYMINAGFGTASESLGVGNPLALIFVLIAYVTLIITALNKCFSAIHVLPDSVMGWIGAKGGNALGSDGAGDVKGAVSGGASQAKSSMESGTKSVTGEGAAKHGSSKKAPTVEGGPVGPGEGGEGPSTKPPPSNHP